MKRLTGILVIGPLALCTGLAWADDMSRVTPTDHQLLTECIQRQMSNNSVTISKSEAKRYCKDELKRQKQTGAGPERQPVDTPPAADGTRPPAAPPPPQ